MIWFQWTLSALCFVAIGINLWCAVTLRARRRELEALSERIRGVLREIGSPSREGHDRDPENHPAEQDRESAS